MNEMILMRKLGPVRMAMVRRGQIKQVILISPELTATEKVYLMRLVEER